MSNISFRRIGEKENTSLNIIDQEIANHCGLEVSNNNWVGEEEFGTSWFDTIGFSLSLGRTYEQVRTFYKEKSAYANDSAVIGFIDKALDYLEANYEPIGSGL